jgi:hypothetical protein
MIQRMIGSYTVDPTETVTIEVVATKVGDFVTAALDGGPLNPVGDPPPMRFQFPVTKSAGQTHFVVLRFVFDATAPDDAKYQVFVEGSKGGGRFMDFTIPKQDPTLSRTLDFLVANPGA